MAGPEDDKQKVGQSGGDHPPFKAINQAFREKTAGGRRATFKEISERANEIASVVDHAAVAGEERQSNYGR